MNHKKGKTHRLLDFFAGKGFYVVLILCVAAIGASGYMLFFGGPGETPDSPSLTLSTPSPTPPPVLTPPPTVSPPPVVNPSPPALPPSSPPPITPSPAAPGVSDDEDVSFGYDGAAAVSGSPVEIPDILPPEAPDQPEKQTFSHPIRGEITVGYSDSADVFFEALREWRFHPGVDIEANAGTPVAAAAAGIVVEVLENAPTFSPAPPPP